MSVDLIRYDLLVQEALRSVVRRVLTDVTREGLPGEHHLYISFDTRAPGVRLSPRLKEKYPEEMTIVLQHQFWDLIVTDTFFEVGLSFNGIPERLHVPFDTLKGFFDPSVKFGLQFEPPAAEEEGDVIEQVEERIETAPTPVETLRPVRSVPNHAAAPKADTGKAGSPKAEPATRTPAAAKSSAAKADAAKSEAGKREAAPAKGVAAKAEKVPSEPVVAEVAKVDDDSAKGGAQVVRLDAFRKK